MRNKQKYPFGEKTGFSYSQNKKANKETNQTKQNKLKQKTQNK